MKAGVLRIFGFSLFFFILSPQLVFADNPLPDALVPSQGAVGIPVEVDADSTYHDGLEALTYLWDWGDGTPPQTGLFSTATHTYTTLGEFIITLTVSHGLFSAEKTFDDPPITILLPPPSFPIPEHGAPAISLPLTLDWEDVPDALAYPDVPGALSYRYELIGYTEWLQGRTQQERDAWMQEWIKQGITDWMEDGIENGFLVTLSQSNPFDSSILKFLEPQHEQQWYIDACYTDPDVPDAQKDADARICFDSALRDFVKNQQKHSWRVKSCEDIQGTTCGPWGQNWDFTYLLGPAVLQIPAAGSTVTIDQNLATPERDPLLLDWDDVPGAKSYDLITLPCPPWGVEDPKKDCYSMPILPEDDILPSRYEDDDCLFQKPIPGAWPGEYSWKVASCLDANAFFCTHPKDINDRGFFTASFPVPLLTPPQLRGPTANPEHPPTDPSNPATTPSVSTKDTLSWDGDSCAYFSQINLYKEGVILHHNDPACGFEEDVCTEEAGDETFHLDPEKSGQLWQGENLNSIFSWSIAPCWGNFVIDRWRPNDCQPTQESEQWYFKTTGAPPVLSLPEDGAFTKIPIKLSWGPVGGAASYLYELSQDGTRDAQENFTIPVKQAVVLSSSTEIPYEETVIESGEQYWWHVKTCVDSETEDLQNKVCGAWSETRSLNTYPLDAPDTPNPPDQGEMMLNQLVSWNAVPAANAYKYQLVFSCRDPEETLPDCLALPVATCPDQSTPYDAKEGIAQTNSFSLPFVSCLGQYTWSVQSCIKEDCHNPAGALSPQGLWSFKTLEPPPPAFAGLVPCGRTSNIHSTPYNETAHCKLEHAGFALQNILDFVLWKVSLFALLMLAVITGATSYFSLGGPNALARIKTVFRSFFTGFLILMFAWMFVNIVLMLFGFQFKFFGAWWELPF